MAEGSKPYHHGSLRAAVITAAVAEVEAVGATGVSLREIARRAGVSHAAPLHHFGDKAGLFTAIATDGFQMTADFIGARAVGEWGFLDGGVAYVLWALEHPGYFEVMYRPRLYRTDDPDLVAARARAVAVLEGSATELAQAQGIDDVAGLVLAGWSLAHGLATLMLAGNLEDRLPPDVDSVRRQLDHGVRGLGFLVDRRETTVRHQDR